MNPSAIISIVLPILGLVGYVNHIGWLFYIAGGLSALCAIPFALSRPFSRLGAGMFACLIGGYNFAGAFLQGIILGSCVAGLFVIPMFLLTMLKK